MSKKVSKDKDELLEKELVQEEMNNSVEVEAEEKDASADENNNDDEIVEELNELEVLNKEIEELKDKHLRLIAEYDNYRKRTLKEKMELSKSTSEKIFVNILPVIDDFDRALSHLDSAKDLDSVKEGINLIYNKFINFMSQNGVKEIDTHEKEFDMDLHEAITKSPAPSGDLKGKIIDCVEKGYMLGDKVIRFPKVVVGE